MTLMQLLACAGMITGAFLILGLKPMEFTDGLFGFLMQKPRTIKEEINEATSRKKCPGLNSTRWPDAVTMVCPR